MLRRSLVRWLETTHQEFLWSINWNAPASVGTQGDTSWVDSLPAWSYITTVRGPTPDFTLVTPVSSPPNPEKMVQYNYLCTRTYDTGGSFELIFIKFAYLMRVHPRVNPIVFGDNWPYRTTDMEENVTPKPVFWLSFSRYGIFYRKNL